MCPRPLILALALLLFSWRDQARKNKNTRALERLRWQLWVKNTREWKNFCVAILGIRFTLLLELVRYFYMWLVCVLGVAVVRGQGVNRPKVLRDLGAKLIWRKVGGQLSATNKKKVRKKNRKMNQLKKKFPPLTVRVSDLEREKLLPRSLMWRSFSLTNPSKKRHRSPMLPTQSN